MHQALFPTTPCSRLPDPEWLEDWLTHKIRFTAEWESRAVGGILRNLSSLFERSLSRCSNSTVTAGAGCRHRVMKRHELPSPEFERKLCLPEQLAERLSALARPLVMTNGCFDILHRGMSPVGASARAGRQPGGGAQHRRLGASARQGDRPINPLAQRAAVMAALESVLVTWFDEDTPAKLIDVVRRTCW